MHKKEHTRQMTEFTNIQYFMTNKFPCSVVNKQSDYDNMGDKI